MTDSIHISIIIASACIAACGFEDIEPDDIADTGTTAEIHDEADLAPLTAEPETEPVKDCLPGFCGSCSGSAGSSTTWCTGVTGAVGPGSCPEGASYQSCGDGCFAGARGGEGGYCGIGTSSGSGECCS